MIQRLDPNRTRNMVFYGRVSTEQEAQLSALKNQMQWYDDQLNFHPNWNCINKYIDEGITGTQAKKRPSFLRMIEDAKAGKFDLIATREVSRFARNIVDTISYTRDLKNNYGVEVFFIEDNIWTMDGDGELRLSIMATLAQEESRKTSERVKAGIKIARDNSVLFGNGNILGYDRVGDTYIINKEQAEVVRFIFDLYLEGYSSNNIRDELCKKGYKTATGKDRWRGAQIINILHNPTYKGVMRYGFTYSNNYLDQKKIRNYDKESYQYQQGDFPAIIEPDKWDKVQEIMLSKTQNTREGCKSRGKRLSNDLWSKKLVCKCGSYMGRTGWGKVKKDGTKDYGYYCIRQKTDGSKKHREEIGLDTEGFCDVPMVPEWKLHFMAKEIIAYVWTNRIESVERTYNKLLEVYEEEAKHDSDYKSKIKEIEKSIEANKKKIDNLIEMRVDGELSKEEFASMRKKYDDKISELKRKIEELESSLKREVENDKLTDKENNGLKGLDEILKALEEAIDFSKPQIDDYIIDQLVYKIVALGNNHFRWYLNLSGANNPDVAADEEIEIDSLPYYEIGVEGNKRTHNLVDADGEDLTPYLNCSNRCGSSTKLGLLLNVLTLDFSTTSAYRQLTGNKLLKYTWRNDLTVEIFVI